MKVKRKRRKISKSERLLYKSMLFISIMFVVGIIFGQTTLSKMNIELEKLKNEVNNYQEDNQSLVMKINEMASLENIKKVTNEQGLVYNNDNIKVISE